MPEIKKIRKISDTQGKILESLTGAEVSAVCGDSDNIDIYLDSSTVKSKIAVASQASGDLLYFNGSIWTRLAKGAENKVLKINTDLPSWQDDVGFVNPMDASGDIIYGGTSGAATKLAKGSDGEVLKLASGIPSWEADTGFDNPMTTAGDIIVGGTSGAAGRLGIGTEGQILKVNSTEDGLEYGDELYNSDIIKVIKSADQTITDYSAGGESDDDLYITLAADGIYELRGMLFVSRANYNYGDSSNDHVHLIWDDGNVVIRGFSFNYGWNYGNYTQTDTQAFAGNSGNANIQTYNFRCVIKNEVSSETEFGIKWAKSTSGEDNKIIKAHTYMIATKF